MLILPVGLENSEVRRQPWVSIAIIGLMIAGFLVLGPPSWGSEWGLRVESQVRAIEDFLLQHPHLAASPDIEPLLSDGVRVELERLRISGTGVETGFLSFVLEGKKHELKILEGELRSGLKEAPAWRFGFVPARPNVADAITSMFLHGGWLHLVGNLLFFFAMGPFLEDVYGRVLFTLLYFSAGIAAALVHGAQSSGSQVPLIGASGAIAGVMGAFLVRLGTSRIRFLFLPIVFLPFIRVRFAMRAAVVLPFWFAEQALLAAKVPEGPGGVAFWAHIGGFVFGIAAAVLIRAARLEERWVDPAIQKEISWSQHPALVRAGEARFGRNFETAQRELATVLREQPDNVDALRLAFDLALDEHRGPDAVRAADRLLPVYLRMGEAQLARALVFDVMGAARESLTPRFGVAAARFLEKEGETAEALDLDETVASRFPTDPAALQALVRIVAMRRERGDEAGLARALETARRHPNFSPEWEVAFHAGGPGRGRS
ncbi:MAG: rhomboid family intramembrane serine protease [Thermoanaerobaculia bacterium]|nr:rhomboid family intramembrane serine protease [Thermoanaerobaculia bacterium]